MQLLAYRDPAGRVHILNEAQALPPLADGHEWTMVMQAHAEPAEPPTQQTAPARPGWLETVIPLLTPRPGQTAKERAQELVDALPVELRTKVSQVVQAFHRPELPTFPRG